MAMGQEPVCFSSDVFWQADGRLGLLDCVIGGVLRDVPGGQRDILPE